MLGIEELERLLSDGAGDGFDWARLMRGPLGSLLSRMAGTPQDARWHGEGDVLTHARMTCRALAELPAFGALPERRRAMLMVAALLHDAGKPDCTRLEDGRWTARGHAGASAQLARELLWAEYALCGAPDALEFRECVCALIERHAVPLSMSAHAEPEREAVRLAALGELAPGFTLDALALLAEADARGRECADAGQLLERVARFREVARAADCLYGPRVFESARARRAYMAGRDVPGPDWGPVVLICGLPGTGKYDYLRRELPGLPVVSPYELGCGMGAAPGERQGEVLSAAGELARTYLRARQPFAWLASSLTPWARARQIALFERYGAAVRVVYLETTLGAQARRNEARARALSDSALAGLRRQTTPPTSAEAQRAEWICV